MPIRNSRDQADAMARANANAFKDMLATRELATKRDLLEATHDLELAIVKTKNDLLKWLAGLIIIQIY